MAGVEFSHSPRGYVVLTTLGHYRDPCDIELLIHRDRHSF